MSDPKKNIESIIKDLEAGNKDPDKAWLEIKKLKESYVSNLTLHHPHIENPEQSWHSFIGRKFEKIIKSILNAYLKEISKIDKSFSTLRVLTDNEIKDKKNEVLFRKIAVKFGDYLLLPDTDLVVVDLNADDVWNSHVLAIISCKTSLRERIAQACYWKLKLLTSDVTKNIKVFLVTADNDQDFYIKSNLKNRINGKSRNRIIAEYELDGIYILRDDFKDEEESSKVKKYEKIFIDLIEIFNKKRG